MGLQSHATFLYSLTGKHCLKLKKNVNLKMIYVFIDIDPKIKAQWTRWN